MVTRSKKPEASAKPKKASKPKAAAKPKTKVQEVKTPEKKTPEARVPEVGRKIGDMIYNDELLESLAEIILLGGEPDDALKGALPEIKKELFDYDIYMVSFLTDEEMNEIVNRVKGTKDGKIPEAALRSRLLAVRDNARIFVDIATKYNSVRAFVDRMIEAEGRQAGFEKLKITFIDGEFKMSEISPECCERYLFLF